MYKYLGELLTDVFPTCDLQTIVLKNVIQRFKSLDEGKGLPYMCTKMCHREE